MTMMKKHEKERSEQEGEYPLRTKKESARILSIIRHAIKGRSALGNIEELENSSPFKILISTILSARTKDSVTERASERLFAKYDDALSLSKADPDKVAEIIKPVLYYSVKAERIVHVSKIIEDDLSGVVPSKLEELMELPGVGRKTANCVLVYGFGIPAIPVDVHVHRVSNRIGLVKTKNPEETEVKLEELYERKYWLDINELFVRFGQTTCLPIGPLCPNCPVRTYCNYFKRLENMGVKKKK